MFKSHLSATLIFVLTLLTGQCQETVKVLLITGGCCHDYDAQKDILKKGLESRADVVVTQVHTPDKSTRPPLEIFGNADYAKGFDLVIHDECAADISDEATVRAVLKPHLEGVPAVNLHCAMHSYRIGNPNDPVTPGTAHGLWFEYLGLQSSGHGPQVPIDLHFTDPGHEITQGMKDWTTIREELYNNIHVFETAHPLVSGKQVLKRRDGGERIVEALVAWTNLYGPNKTRVFSTTLGHNSETVEDPRYLDLVVKGVHWALGED